MPIGKYHGEKSPRTFRDARDHARGGEYCFCSVLKFRNFDVTSKGKRRLNVAPGSLTAFLYSGLSPESPILGGNSPESPKVSNVLRMCGIGESRKIDQAFRDPFE
jgi:hypothetical protein